MPSYDELRTTAFHLRPDAVAGLDGDYRVLDFPRGWIEPILALLAEQGADRPRTVPIAALNRAMRALVPDVAAVGRGVGMTDHGGGWLYSVTPPDVASLEPIVLAWLTTLRPDLGLDRASRLWERLRQDPLCWRPVRPAEFGWPTGPAAVAADTPEATQEIAALPRALFHLVPEVLSAELLTLSDHPDNHTRGFRRCPTSDGRGVDLVSWPPYELSDRQGRRWPYSYRVTLTVQTVPFQPLPVLHVTSGIRRWCPKAPSSGGRSLSLYMLTSVPWIAGTRRSRSFRVAPVGWQQANGAWQFGWRKPVRHIFEQIAFERPLPDLRLLAKAPLDQIEGDNAIALLYTTMAGYPHAVQAGVHARERDQLIQWVETTLSDFIAPAPKARQTGLRFRNPTTPAAAETRAAVANAIGSQRLIVDLLWDTEPVRDAIQTAIATDLDLPATTQHHGVQHWHTPELDVVVRPHSVGQLGTPLRLDTSTRNPQLRRKRAADLRRQEVQATLPAATEPTLAIVELRDRDAFDPGTDPKHPLRIGLADTGRHSQFITPIPDLPPYASARDHQNAIDELQHRAAAAVADLRRQLAARTEPLRTTITKIAIPDPIDYVAIWMIRRNATRGSWDRYRLPVAVWMSSDSTQVWVRSLGMTGWKPYREALTEISRTTGGGLSFCGEDKVTRFVSDVLDSVSVSDRPILLLTAAQNLRNSWTALQNSALTIDQVGLGAVQYPISKYPNLRHVHIRTDDDHETPDCYGIDDDQARIGLPSGLWRIPGSSRVFASTASKPASARKHGLPMSHRLETRITKSGAAVIDDRKPSWNSQLVELTIAAIQEGDDPLTWAAITHALRRKADNYRGELIYALPLHLAKLIGEYALPATDDELEPENDTDLGVTAEEWRVARDYPDKL